MDKKTLRKTIRSMKRQFTHQQLDELSEDVIRKLMAEPRIMKAETIMLYYSLDDEVNTHNVIDELVRMGKRVVLPVVTSPTDMEVRLYTGPKDLRKGSFGILEPSGRSFDSFDEIDVAVIPGMGFDEAGNRLGRGKGYYDRFLCRIPNAYKIGICFPFQKVEKVPVDGNDVKMDKVIC